MLGSSAFPSSLPSEVPRTWPCSALLVLALFAATACSSSQGSQSSQNEAESRDAELLAQFKEVMSRYRDKGLLPMVSKSPPMVPKSSGPNFLLGPLPEGGVVPDAATAVRLAEILLSARYGEEDAARQLPLEAHLVNNDYWEVYAKRNGSKTLDGGISTNLGGVAEVAIRRSDGAVLGIGKPK